MGRGCRACRVCRIVDGGGPVSTSCIVWMWCCGLGGSVSVKGGVA